MNCSRCGLLQRERECTKLRGELNIAINLLYRASDNLGDPPTPQRWIDKFVEDVDSFLKPYVDQEKSK